MPKHRRSRASRAAQLLQEEAAEQYRRHQEARADGSAQTGVIIARLAAQRSANRRWGACPQPDGDEDQKAE